MAGKGLAEKLRLIKLVTHTPFKEAESKKWLEEIEANGLTEPLLVEIRDALTGLPDDVFPNTVSRIQSTTELARITQQWRMALASKNFHHSR